MAALTTVNDLLAAIRRPYLIRHGYALTIICLLIAILILQLRTQASAEMFAQRLTDVESGLRTVASEQARRKPLVYAKAKPSAPIGTLMD